MRWSTNTSTTSLSKSQRRTLKAASGTSWRLDMLDPRFWRGTRHLPSDPFYLAGITFNGEGHRVEPTSLGRPSLWTWCFWVNRGYGYSGLKVLSEVQYTTRLLSQTQLGISMDFKGQNFGTNVNELTPRCFQMGRPEEKVHTLRAASLWGCGTLPQRWDPKLTHTLTRTDKLD